MRGQNPRAPIFKRCFLRERSVQIVRLQVLVAPRAESPCNVRKRRHRKVSRDWYNMKQKTRTWCDRGRGPLLPLQPVVNLSVTGTGACYPSCTNVTARAMRAFSRPFHCFPRLHHREPQSLSLPKISRNQMRFS